MLQTYPARYASASSNYQLATATEAAGFIYQLLGADDPQDLIEQLSVVLLVGDFNAYNRTWVCQNTDKTAMRIEDLCLTKRLSF